MSTSKRQRRLWGIGLPVAAALIAAGATGVVLNTWEATSHATTDAIDHDSAITATAERVTLTSDLVLSAQLGYGDAIPVPGRQGTVTALPQAGQEITVGDALYEVDGVPVIAVLGERPFWRDMQYGVSDGPDVLQLKQALEALGYAENITVDSTFTWNTGKAVKAWQESLGLEETGTIALGDIVAVSSDVIRVASVTAHLGDPAQTSPLTYTGTTLTATADLTQDQSRQITAGTAVTVRLPDGAEVAAKITEIDPGGESQSDGSSTSASATITFDDPESVANVGLRAVRVTLVREQVDDALVVPVTALIATSDGGYAVDVVTADEIVRVPVELGLIADTRAQVVGGELAEGDTVVVAR